MILDWRTESSEIGLESVYAQNSVLDGRNVASVLIACSAR